MKHGPADRDTDTHPRRAHEGVHSRGGGSEFWVCVDDDGLDAEVDGGEDHAGAGGEDCHADEDDSGRDGDGDGDEDAGTNGCCDKASPDEVPVGGEAADEDGDDDGAGQHEDGAGEHVDARADFRIEVDGEEVEGEVVETHVDLGSVSFISRIEQDDDLPPVR